MLTVHTTNLRQIRRLQLYVNYNVSEKWKEADSYVMSLQGLRSLDRRQTGSCPGDDNGCEYTIRLLQFSIMVLQSPWAPDGQSKRRTDRASLGRLLDSAG